MKVFFFLLANILFVSLGTAQFIQEKSINAQIGYGLSAPINSVDESVDTGLFLQGELVLKVKSWVELRPYAGFIFTNANGQDLDNNPTDEIAESKAFLLGGKVRLSAPIPWVAPYIEGGIGASIGSFRTVTIFENIDKSGLIYHIPISLGLALGPKNSVDLGFAYYFQPSVEQFAGAFALGISIPLKNR